MVLEWQIITVTLILFNVGISVMLWRRNRQQATQLQRLNNESSEFRTDLAALCAGAVGLGSRISRTETRSRRLKSRQEQLEMRDIEQRPYDHAIRMVHNGAITDEIMQVCNLGRNEADLIITMHRVDQAS